VPSPLSLGITPSAQSSSGTAAVKVPPVIPPTTSLSSPETITLSIVPALIVITGSAVLIVPV